MGMMWVMAALWGLWQTALSPPSTDVLPRLDPTVIIFLCWAPKQVGHHSPVWVWAGQSTMQPRQRAKPQAAHGSGHVWDPGGCLLPKIRWGDGQQWGCAAPEGSQTK